MANYPPQFYPIDDCNESLQEKLSKSSKNYKNCTIFRFGIGDFMYKFDWLDIQNLCRDARVSRLGYLIYNVSTFKFSHQVGNASIINQQSDGEIL